MQAWVTGGTGFVGSNIVAEFLATGNQVHCAVHERIPQRADSWSKMDLLDTAAVRADVEQVAPDVLVHCAIRNQLVGLTDDWSGAWADFVDATRNVVDAANTVDALVVLVSTDWVFDGSRPRTTEDWPPRPINSYGLLKFAQERVVAERAQQGAIARVSGVNGLHREDVALPRTQDVGFGYLVLALVDSLADGEPFTVWESERINMVASPSLASASARMIRQIADLGAEGVFHCCGSSALTRRQLAELACDVFGLDAGLVHYGSPDAAAMPTEPVPYDTSLDTAATARRLGLEPLDARELLISFRDEWVKDRTARRN